MSNKPKINIDFHVNARGQLVQYFVNPFNASHGYIIDGSKGNTCLVGNHLFYSEGKFTFLENTYRL